jgi:hypothetical protein
VLGVNAAIQWRRYRRTLVPRRTRLRQILVSFQDETHGTGLTGSSGHA